DIVRMGNAGIGETQRMRGIAMKKQFYVLTAILLVTIVILFGIIFRGQFLNRQLSAEEQRYEFRKQEQDVISTNLPHLLEKSFYTCSISNCSIRYDAG
ncbi:MAG: hypothetical protein Q4D42_05935, partial [Eubacteriales bacterium]|nr:hypothetical protein [Eubacteriales bacterium]